MKKPVITFHYLDECNGETREITHTTNAANILTIMQDFKYFLLALSFSSYLVDKIKYDDDNILGEQDLF